MQSSLRLPALSLAPGSLILGFLASMTTLHPLWTDLGWGMVNEFSRRGRWSGVTAGASCGAGFFAGIHSRRRGLQPAAPFRLVPPSSRPHQLLPPTELAPIRLGPCDLARLNRPLFAWFDDWIDWARCDRLLPL